MKHQLDSKKKKLQTTEICKTEKENLPFFWKKLILWKKNTVNAIWNNSESKSTNCKTTLY